MRAACAVIAFALFVVLSLAREAWCRLRHGRNWEPGDGLGRDEDYENHGCE